MSITPDFEERLKRHIKDCLNMDDITLKSLAETENMTQGDLRDLLDYIRTSELLEETLSNIIKCAEDDLEL